MKMKVWMTENLEGAIQIVSETETERDFLGWMRDLTVRKIDVRGQVGLLIVSSHAEPAKGRKMRKP